MNPSSMTSMERVVTALSHREPDRVPYFLLLTLHGAKELGLGIRDYFSKGSLVAEGQLRLRAKFGHDCFYNFFYAPIEYEAWGGEVVYRDDGPPNSGEALIRELDDIRRLTPPSVAEAACLRKVLESQRLLFEKSKGEVPSIGVVMSPFSLPVMQVGFARYLELIYERPELLEHLLRINERFCVEWANAQLEAGATAICYFDPVSSPTILPREKYLKIGQPVARRTLAQIKGPCAIHLASGICLPILEDLIASGAAAVGVSAREDLSQIKAVCRGRTTVLGNLNGTVMRRWSAAEAEAQVREALRLAGSGGGFILADNHGEIPFQVPDEVLLAIGETVRSHGRHPLKEAVVGS